MTPRGNVSPGVTRGLRTGRELALVAGASPGPTVTALSEGCFLPGSGCLQLTQVPSFLGKEEGSWTRVEEADQRSTLSPEPMPPAAPAAHLPVLSVGVSAGFSYAQPSLPTAAWVTEGHVAFKPCPIFATTSSPPSGEPGRFLQGSFEALQANGEPTTAFVGVELDLELLPSSFRLPERCSLGQGICRDFLIFHSHCLKADARTRDH